MNCHKIRHMFAKYSLLVYLIFSAISVMASNDLVQSCDQLLIVDTAEEISSPSQS